jgi:hypothetical protein
MPARSFHSSSLFGADLIRTRPVGALRGSDAGSGSADRFTVTTVRSEQDRERSLAVRMGTIVTGSRLLWEFGPKPVKPGNPERCGTGQ